VINLLRSNKVYNSCDARVNYNFTVILFNVLLHVLVILLQRFILLYVLLLLF